MDSRFIDGDVHFMKMEEAWSSFAVVVSSIDPCIFISWVDLLFMEKFLEEVAGVAVHVGCAWLDEGLSNVVDDLIIQP